MTDTYKENILPRLGNSDIYKTLIGKVSSNNALDGEVKDTIHKAVGYAYNRAKLTVKYMPEYTLHDEEHLFKVLQLMEKLIPESLLDDLDVPELMLLILSAFFHDLGMAPSQQDVDAWLGNFDVNSASNEQIDKRKTFEKFKYSHINDNRGKYHEVEISEGKILSDFIRINHASHIRAIIAVEYKAQIKYKTTDLTAVLIDICESHNMPSKKLLDFESSHPCGDGIYICIPFIAVLLRLADVLDFDTERTPEVLFRIMNVNTPISIKEWKKHLSIQNWDISGDRITFYSVCEHPQIEYAVRTFCETIDIELNNCRGVLSNLKDHIRKEKLKEYNIPLPLNVDQSKITAKKDLLTNRPLYRYSNIRFVLNKESIINLLMGSSLYGNSIVALRELLQNSIDTCLLRQVLCDKKNIQYTPVIKVAIDTKKRLLTVSDNGMGMNEDDINKYYANIGTSFYKSPDFLQLKAENEIKFTSISRFGIGILSCFMISDTINIETLKYKDSYNTDVPIKVTIEGSDNIFHIIDNDQKEPGTKTTLELNTNNQWVNINKDEFFKVVKKTLRYPPIEVDICYNEESCRYNKEEARLLTPKDVLLEQNDQWGNSIEDGLMNYDIKIDDVDLGYQGNISLLLLEENKNPVPNIKLPSKTVDINGQEFEFDREFNYGLGQISKSSGEISLDNNDAFSLNTCSYIYSESKSSFSIHGIEYTSNLFYRYNSTKGAKLKWPIPMLLILNYGNPNDLDLNSARDEIIQNEKWNNFEQNLAYLIFMEIYKSTSAEYWDMLYEVFLAIRSHLYNDNFYIGLEKANTEISERI